LRVAIGRNELRFDGRDGLREINTVLSRLVLRFKDRPR